MNKMKNIISRYKILIFLIVVILLALFPLMKFNEYIYRIAVVSGLYAILAISLNLIAGVAGQISLGHVAYYGVGAYTSALLTVNFGIPVGFGILAAFVVSALMGLLIALPSLKLSGGYLAIITLSFAEIIRLILLNWISVTRGPMGILNIPKPKLFGITLTHSYSYFYIVLLVGIIIYILLYNLMNSKFGRNLKALRDDEISSVSMGINVYRHKVVAFVTAAGIAGVAGALYAHYMEFIDPSSFIGDESTVILSMVVLGGMGKMNGSLIAAILLTVLPEMLRSFSNYRMLVYGMVLVLMMLLKIMDWDSIKRSLGQMISFEKNNSSR